jgi:pimeloyl-ACP methyl ester carboxylesterase
MADRITLTTVDDMMIVGDWVPSPRMIGVAILLHMMPETRASWAMVQIALSRKGIASLAIDLRGHGDSVKTTDGFTLNYKEFTEEDHLTTIDDVRAALDWVRKRGVDMSRIVLVGASIGANIALNELTDEPHIAGAVLLSPGENYHGFEGMEDVGYVLPDHQLVIVSAEDDPESFGVSRRMYAEACCTKKSFVPYTAGGHGTNLLKSDPSLAEKIADWCVTMVSG